MLESLVSRIKDHALSLPEPPAFPPASEESVLEAERRLGFPIPTLLKLCYLRVANGGFGPGFGIIGVSRGCESDFGTLVETYEQLKGDYASQDLQRNVALLPFCEWGCGIFSCVDCRQAQHAVSVFEDFQVWPQDFGLLEFFEMWMAGVEILSHGVAEWEELKIINPFTGQPTSVRRRRRK